jgi:hypothetical protein
VQDSITHDALASIVGDELSVPSTADAYVTDIIVSDDSPSTISIFLFELLKQTDKGYLSKDLSLLRHQFLFSENSSGNSKVFRFGYQESNKNYNFLIQQIFENKAVLFRFSLRY